jgi:Gamma-glutamylcysteine synthetase
MIRPKSMSNEDIRPTSKLRKFGVEYIEVRSLDIDPWSPIGINQSTVSFIEALILYSSFCESPPISDSEYKTIRKNNHLVATLGRQPNLYLEKDEKNISLKEWARCIIDEMEPFLHIVKVDSVQIDNYKEMISNPEYTPSARLINGVLKGSYSLDEYMANISEKNKEYFLSIDKNTNDMWEKFDAEFEISLDKQKKLEQLQEVSFEEFLNSYINS